MLPQTDKKKMRQTLLRIEQTLKARMHEKPAGVGAWLKSVLLGYYRYFAVPGNTPVLFRRARSAGGTDRFSRLY